MSVSFARKAIISAAVKVLVEAQGTATARTLDESDIIFAVAQAKAAAKQLKARQVQDVATVTYVVRFAVPGAYKYPALASWCQATVSATGKVLAVTAGRGRCTTRPRGRISNQVRVEFTAPRGPLAGFRRESSTLFVD